MPPATVTNTVNTNDNHNSISEYKCDDCGTNYKMEDDLRYHNRNVHKRIDCTNCDFAFYIQ